MQLLYLYYVSSEYQYQFSFHRFTVKKSLIWFTKDHSSSQYIYSTIPNAYSRRTSHSLPRCPGNPLYPHRPDKVVPMSFELQDVYLRSMFHIENTLVQPYVPYINKSKAHVCIRTCRLVPLRWYPKTVGLEEKEGIGSECIYRPDGCHCAAHATGQRGWSWY